MDDITRHCVEWDRSLHEGGYGQIHLRSGLGGKPFVHRLVWEENHGPIQPGMQVLHHCDNPPCINPDHLFLGTQADNMRDMDEKSRRRGFGAENAAKTHCKRGHALSGENLSIGALARGFRVCNPCRRARWSEKGASH